MVTRRDDSVNDVNVITLDDRRGGADVNPQAATATMAANDATDAEVTSADTQYAYLPRTREDVTVAIEDDDTARCWRACYG